MEEFEKDIKNYFKDREMQPSADAWQRMEQLLDQSPKKPKSKNMFFYISVAASVVLIFGLWMQFKPENQVLPTNIPQNNLVTNQSVVSEITKETNNEDEITTKQKQNNKENVQKHVVSNHQVITKPSIIKSSVNNTSSKIDKIEEQLIVVEDKLTTNKTEEKNYTDVVEEQQTLIVENSNEIKVDRSKLLKRAELERHVDHVNSEVQNFMKKVGEKHSIVHRM